MEQSLVENVSTFSTYLLNQNRCLEKIPVLPMGNEGSNEQIHKVVITNVVNERHGHDCVDERGSEASIFLIHIELFQFAQRMTRS